MGLGWICWYVRVAVVRFVEMDRSAFIVGNIVGRRLWLSRIFWKLLLLLFFFFAVTFSTLDRSQDGESVVDAIGMVSIASLLVVV
jgi:hypothetical protein